MKLYANQLFHIYNQGNNRQKIFFTEANYIFFLKKIKTHLIPNCEILSWCLMPNHFHFLIFIKRDQDPEIVSKAIQVILRSYTRAINIQEGRTGSLFRQGTKSEALRDEIKPTKYAENCFHYIHKNPLKAGLEKNLGDWKFSSLPDYLNLRNGQLINKTLAFEYLEIPQEIPKLTLATLAN